MTIGNRIKQYRKMNGFTQVQLAEKSNISRSYLGDIEGNRYNPSVDTLISIANALNISLATILEGLDDYLPYSDKDNQLDQKRSVLSYIADEIAENIGFLGYAQYDTRKLFDILVTCE